MNGTLLRSGLALVASMVVVACGASQGKQPSATLSNAEHEEHAHAAEGEPSFTSKEERDAYEKARPVFETYCAKCHTTQGKGPAMALHHFNMGTYPFGGHHADEITAAIREVLGASGKPPTMPRDNPGAVKGEDLELILAWADAYDRAHPTAGTSEVHHDHHHDEGDEHDHDHHHESDNHAH